MLNGIRVIEFSHIMAAPTCGLMLSDMGADVVKVERLPGGDDVRHLEPFVGGVSNPFAMMNRNKRGVALNLRTDGGKKALKRLILDADIFIENYRTGAMEHYGVGYEQVRDGNPNLIYCSVSGYGRSGPFADKGGFDLVAQGMSGLMSITGEGAGRPPIKVGAPVTDITAGTLAAMGILGALVSRGTTGKGQYLDTSLFEAGIMHTYWQSAIYFGSGQVPQAMGSAHPLMAPYQAFETKDGWINVGSASQGLWEKLIVLLGVPELLEDDRFTDPNLRRTNLDDLNDILTEHFRRDDTAIWVERLEEAGIPSGPVLDIGEMISHPQVLARGMVQEIEEGLRVIGHPVKYEGTPASIQRGAPKLGEHTADVLLEAGYSNQDIQTLAANGEVLLGD